MIKALRRLRCSSSTKSSFVLLQSDIASGSKFAAPGVKMGVAEEEVVLGGLKPVGS